MEVSLKLGVGIFLVEKDLGIGGIRGKDSCRFFRNVSHIDLPSITIDVCTSDFTYNHKCRSL